MKTRAISLVAIVVLTALALMMTLGDSVPVSEASHGTNIPPTLSIEVSGTVNGDTFTVTGSGVVDPIGVYTVDLEFSSLPSGFHPIFMTIVTVSISCYGFSEEIDGGINMHTLLGDNATYNVERLLTFPLTGDQLTVTGAVTLTANAFAYSGTINGTTPDPGDLTGVGGYQLDITPAGPGAITSSGQGQLTRASGPQIAVELEENISFDPEFSLPFPQIRTVDESGSLDGLTYHVVLHSAVKPAPVGGTVELPGGSESPGDASESSARDYTAPIAAAVAASAVALTAGGWYARRRWLR